MRDYLRRLPKFEYLQPKTVQEACSLLSQYKDKAKIIAGGTDLLPRLKRREVAAEYVIGLKGILGLDYIKYSKTDGLRFGALATLHAIETSPIIKEKFYPLFQAVYSMASPQIRSRGTVGGNLCNAAPSADTAPALITLGARLKLVSPRGERTTLVEEFFTGPGETLLSEDELVVEVQVPNMPLHSGGVYLKQMIRRAMDLAIVGVAAVMTSDGGVCKDIKIVLGAVAPTPIRASKAEQVLKGKMPEDSLIEEAAKKAAGEARPISDIRSSLEYRKAMVEVLTRKAVKQAWEKATVA